jgi:pimeloyl-ACP methyl ester carboxylesterase
MNKWAENVDVRQFVTQHGTRLRIGVSGSGPLVVLVHGFPDSWISWRHQIPVLAGAGYTVVALETRGYGKSSCPPEIEHYTLPALAEDIIAVIDELGFEKAVLVGHDWGGAQVFATALLHPERVQAVASFAFTAPLYSDVKPSEMWRNTYTEELFYQNYFAEPGVAEAEFEVDPARSLRLFLYALSGDRPASANGLIRPAGTTSLLEGLPEPHPFPHWLDEEELSYYAESFASSGFTGPINRYRAQDLDVELMRPYADRTIDQPVLWVGAAKDPARYLVPGVDKYLNPVPRCTDVRGTIIIEDVGHWIQQEAPQQSNAALLEFLKSATTDASDKN